MAQKRGTRMMLQYFLLAVLLCLCITSCSDDNLGEWGKFDSKVKAEWLDAPDNRKMKLLSDFIYTDAKGKDWVARENAIIDGASIPPCLWSIIGSPFEGGYRNASVVHDTACFDNQRHGRETWEDVHMMFYEACRCGGVSKTKAKLMYWGVYHFGPRWEVLKMAEWSASEERIKRVRPIPRFSIDTRIRDLVKEKKLKKELVFTGRRVPAIAVEEATLVPDREEINRELVNSRIEKYFENKDLTLADIKSLSLEEVLRDQE